MPADGSTARPKLAANLALALISCSLTALAVLVALKLFHPRFSGVELSDLDSEERQLLARELIEVSGTGYLPALHEPGVGYTLEPNSDLELWNDSFTSNQLGYRAPDETKGDGVFRIVLVGDSWTYGMGVSAEQTFAARLGTLANNMLSDGPELQTWPLALPGYNTLNGLAALEIYHERLQPDAVVLCPTANDANSSFVVTPAGLPRRPSGDHRDRFGHDHWLSYGSRFPASFLLRQRWRQATAAIRATETWLAEREVPFFLFFVARWQPGVVHDLVREAGLESPYLILPEELAQGPWRGGPPFGHGTPEAYEVFSRLIYRLLAPTLSWPELPLDPELDPFPAAVFSEVPAGDWRRQAAVDTRPDSQAIPTRFSPGGPAIQCVANMDCASGRMGRRTTILVRRREGASRLAIELERHPGVEDLYPLELEASIPAAGGGTRVTTMLPATGPERHRFELELPSDIAVGEVMDIQLRARRAVVAKRALTLWSANVKLIEQEP